MAQIRQLPRLYLRGALANQTMTHLTDDEKQKAEAVTKLVSTHPAMQQYRQKVIRRLSTTIAADYANDTTAAEQEFVVAIWKGVVDLFFHRPYSYVCTACNQSTYMTKRQKPKQIDRIQTPCPNCKSIKIKQPGHANNLKTGDILTIAAFQDSYKHLGNDAISPTYESTIIPIKGNTRYENPERIINDETQLQKFFGEYVNNYVRQQINENRQVSNKNKKSIYVSADVAVLHDILGLCSKSRTKHAYCAKTSPHNGLYTVTISGVQTDPDFTVELQTIIAKAQTYNVVIIVDNGYISIKEDKNSIQVSTSILVPELINIVDNQSTKNDDIEQTIDGIGHKSIGAERMEPTDHIHQHALSEAFQKVRKEIPDGECKQVFDILSQNGEAYQIYTTTYGDETAKTNNIARLLGVSTRTINHYKQIIQTVCMANDLVPS